MGKRQGWLVALIGVFKLVKAVALITFGALVVAEPPGRLAGIMGDAIGWTGGSAGRETVLHLIGRLAVVPPSTARHLGVAALAYAIVFSIEGIGLLSRRRWAEWLTVVVTISFIPLEIYELARHPGVGKVVALILNVAIALYLTYRRFEESARLRRLVRRHHLKLVGQDGRTFAPNRRVLRS